MTVVASATVSSAAGRFLVGNGWRSPVKESGEFSRTFDNVGTYDYHCSLHPYTKRRVVVGE